MRMSQFKPITRDALVESLSDRIITVIGPTASGKSRLASTIANFIGGELISADSVQIYKGLDILSAKTSPQSCSIPQHLVDILEIDQRYSAGQFQKDALTSIESIRSKHKIPIIVGGTALYIKTLTHGVVDVPKISDEVDLKVRLMRKNHGLPYCYTQLQEVDPERAAELSKNDTQRILRALALFFQTGEKMSQISSEHGFKEKKIEPIYVMFDFLRSEIYQRINQRIEQMIESGGVEEVSDALNKGYGKDSPGLKTIGYKQITSYILGECSLEQAKTDMATQTRRYAKRQLTWYRSYQDILKLNPDNTDEQNLQMIQDYSQQLRSGRD